MTSEEGEFWDQRYRSEGAIWGEMPSATARIAARYLRRDDRVLDIGFGYGRDLPFLIEHGCRVAGIDLSVEGQRLAQERLSRRGLEAESLQMGRFEEHAFPAGAFDVAISHRMLHLLVSAEAIARFAAKAAEILRPGGILCLGARNPRDLNLREMIQVADNVFEYRHRPGHRIRYWDEEAFRQSFGRFFGVLSQDEVLEAETMVQPVPCHLTVVVGKKNGLD